MPSIQNPFSLANSENFKNAVKGALFQYAGNVLRNEAPIVSPNTGYKAYDKRMAFAAKVIQNPDLYATQAAALVALTDSLNEIDEHANFRWMYQDNGSGGNVMNWRGEVADQSVGDTYNGTLTIFDALSGVNKGDLI